MPDTDTAPTELKHAFLAIVGAGHPGIFVRKGKSRYPIAEMVGLAAPQMIGARRSWPAIDAELHRYFAGRIQANLNYFMNVQS